MVEISTSLLSVEKEKIIKTIYNLETAKTDYFHIDVMDGKFVEDNTSEKMMEYCDYLSNVTNVPLDIHLMVSDVYKYIDMFLPYNPNIITIHYEALKEKNKIMDVLDYIKSNNCKAGIAIKPNTDVSEILELLEFTHIVLVMTVEPGKGGQELIKTTLNKIEQISEYITKNNIDTVIEADGGINISNIEDVKKAGAEIIVSGTGIIKSDNYDETIKKMKQ
ncbi:MAG: ribulose-phosphate 3-epimerase [Clostridia bacterium]|nr:ribulose-phosphate 3-epimerase [Clostridia bacterium]